MANGWRCCYCCWNEERTALLQLKANIKYSTSDDDYLSSWGANETSDCCRWEGIVCSNTTRRVIELSIIAKEEQLSNGFEKLRRLRKLEVLDLSGNSFNHSIFEPISQLSSLKSLNLSRNFIGLLSERLSGLDKLEILDLSYNYLDFENIFSTLHFPNWLLENNSRLGEVHLDGNAFTGSLQLPFLPNLEALDISNNKIQGELPSNIGSIFPKLSGLIMSNNMLEGLFPSNFGDMEDLF
ncbi:hypothetical protein T459_29127 [Capsicum annuum]|uniref:Leucine-rich repeat-containing N-terminal plant-type domain-containing protein n=1 Tax=Capsicum annuum TaxID=4072 RepID=A0A2G2Y4N8_CAPAN|nr:hypothetical protein T459_29127 [Capsicum annuum]